MKGLFLSLLLALTLLFSSGCTKIIEVPVYIEAACPRIEVLDVVGPIEVDVDTDNAVRGKSLSNLITGVKDLRSGEKYYIEQITTYNKTFVDK